MDMDFVGVDTAVHSGSIFYSITVIKTAIKNSGRRLILTHTTIACSYYKSASIKYTQMAFVIS